MSASVDTTPIGNVQRWRPVWRLLSLVAVLSCGIGGAQPHTAHARPLRTGLQDSLFQSGDPAQRARSLDVVQEVGGSVVRLAVDWRATAPAAKPLLFDPSNPADSAYRFQTLDAAVRDATARGLTVLLTVSRAPDWAEGPERRRGAAPGTWRPDPAAYGAFVHALASRYSGSFLDPQRPGEVLPRVTYYQAWNEANLSVYLTPQWVRGRAESPLIYRDLLNAFYTAVKSVDAGNVVVSTGTAPYGDPGHRQRMRPVRFLRTLFCLRGRRKLHPTDCPDPAHLDVLAHHPIDSFRPTRGAENRDDASTPDIGRIRRVLRRARKAHTVEPGGRVPVWATELWWDSRPPKPGGVRPGRQGRWYEQALYLLWRQRVTTVVLLRAIDGSYDPSDPNGYGSGLLFSDDRRKPAFKAVRFPFVAPRLGPGRVRLWGLSPASGEVLIERLRHGQWHTVRRLRARVGVPFTRTLHSGKGLKLRAVASGTASLSWRVPRGR